MPRKVEFTPPEGLAVPEGKTSGDTFESMATFRITPGGRLCLVAVGEAKMPGYDDATTHDEGREVASKYRKALNVSPDNVSNY